MTGAWVAGSYSDNGMIKSAVRYLTGCEFQAPAKMPQVDKNLRHQLHAVMPLLNELEPQQQSFEFILPCEASAQHAQSQRMNGGIEQPLPPALPGSRDCAGFP